MKKIVIFNHKGGVSKTTSVFHIGWALANAGKKVLLVDADPQCNLTAMFLGADFENYYIEEATGNQNIKDGVAPAFAGAPRPIEPITCPVQKNPNLYLLPGHPDLGLFESSLRMVQDSPSVFQMMNMPGSFNDLIEKTGSNMNADYALIDLNPAISAINQNLFMISDGFIIPTNPDMFSVMAMKSLSDILPSWGEWKERVIDSFSATAYPYPAGTPKFLGYILSRFTIRNGGPAVAFNAAIDNIQNTVRDVLLPKLKSKGMVFTHEYYVNAETPENLELAEIKDFTSLGQKGNLYNVPVFELNDKMLDQRGTVLRKSLENVTMFREIYSKIAQNIIKLLDCA